MISVHLTRYPKRVLIFAVCCILSLSIKAQEKQEVINNQSIITLVKAGLDNSVIISKINGANTKFDVSVAGLTTLKKQGVSNEIIAAIVGKSDNPGASQKSSAPVPAGVSSKKVQNVNHPYLSSGTSLAATEKTTATFKAKKIAMGYGGANYQYEASGAKSSVRVAASDQLHFLVNTGGGSLPDFVLYKTSVSDGKRIALIGKVKVFSADAMQSGKDAIIFTATAEGNNIYKLTPSVKLQAGEYMFIPKSAATSLTGSDVYAFGID